MSIYQHFEELRRARTCGTEVVGGGVGANLRVHCFDKGRHCERSCGGVESERSGNVRFFDMLGLSARFIRRSSLRRLDSGHVYENNPSKAGCESLKGQFMYFSRSVSKRNVELDIKVH